MIHPNILSGGILHYSEAATAAAAAVPNLVRLLQSYRDVVDVPVNTACTTRDADNVVTQAMWALANIAGDGRELRDRVLDAGALPWFLQAPLLLHGARLNPSVRYHPRFPPHCLTHHWQTHQEINKNWDPHLQRNRKVVQILPLAMFHPIVGQLRV